MTSNQLIAMFFPMLTLVAAGVVALVVAKPWSKTPRASRRQTPIEDVPSASVDERRNQEMRESLREAQALLRKVEQQLPKVEAH